MNTTTATIAAQVAATILQQMGGKAKLQAIVNAKNFVSGTTDGNHWVSFYHAKGQNKANCTRITLASNDTYTVEFVSVRSPNYTVRSTHTDVYCDSLIKLWESEVNLCLTFR
jgi:hypothetical protein